MPTQQNSSNNKLPSSDNVHKGYFWIRFLFFCHSNSSFFYTFSYVQYSVSLLLSPSHSFSLYVCHSKGEKKLFTQTLNCANSLRYRRGSFKTLTNKKNVIRVRSSEEKSTKYDNLYYKMFSCMLYMAKICWWCTHKSCFQHLQIGIVNSGKYNSSTKIKCVCGLFVRSLVVFFFFFFILCMCLMAHDVLD